MKDASQCFGKIPISVENIKCDYLVLAGHKFYGPRIGALYARDPSNLQPMLFGGGQERGLRPGTENTPMIVGLGAFVFLNSDVIVSFLFTRINQIMAKSKTSNSQITSSFTIMDLFL